jgi:glucokinase
LKGDEALVADKVVAVDLGGTRIRAALAQTDGKLLNIVRTSTEAEKGPEVVIAKLEQAIREAAGEAWAEVSGIGMIAPGPLDPWEGVIIHAPNLPGWHNVPLKAIFEESLQRPVRIGNDANLAALAEQQFGAGRGLKDLIYLTISTGIGSGIIIDNRLLLGTDGLGGEAGHMVIDPRGPLCNCGTRGCLEAMASGTGIARRARERITQTEGQMMVQLAGNVEAVTAEVVGRAAQAGDPLAASLIQEAAELIGVAIISLMRLFNPQIFIIGGGVSKLGDFFFGPIRQTVQANLLRPYWENCPIVPVTLGDDVGLLGGVALIRGEI